MVKFWFVLTLFALLSNAINYAICEQRDSYFGGLKDTMSSLRSFFNSGLEGLARLAETIETIDKFVDATIEEDCAHYICPPGMVRLSNPDHVTISNGCGSFGIEWKESKLPHKEFKKCCDEHDYCYDECGSDKDMCDVHFKKCLYKVCSIKSEELSIFDMKACKGTAKVMYTGTLALGCKAFQDAQQKACRCIPRKEL